MNILSDGQAFLRRANCLIRAVNKYVSAFIFTIAFFYPMHAFSASSVEIVAKQRVIIAQTRGIVTLPFNVVNRSNKTQQFSEKIDLPEGWRLLANSGFFTLNQGESSLRLVHVLAPSDIPAGKYKLPYQVISKDNLSIRAEQEITIVIKSLSKLTVSIVEQPEIVLAGEQYVAKVSVKNNGNIPLSLAAKLKNTSPYPATFEPQQLELKPSEESVITITSRIPENLKESIFHNLKLSLIGDSILVDKSIKTRIVSFKPKGTGLYHTIPSKVTSTYTNNKGSDAFQNELRASGLLDIKGEHHLDFLYRDMKTNDISSLGSDSEKRLAYDNSEVSVRLGDFSYRLEGITSNGFYGEGAEVHYHPVDEEWNVRVLNAKQIEDDEETADISGFEVGYNLSENLNLSLNAVVLEDSENTPLKQNLTGMDLSWDKYEAAEIRLSVAKDDDGKAFRLRQEGTLGSVNYDYEIQQASAEFDGLIKDIESEVISVSYSFNEGRSYLRANVYHARNNLDEDPRKRISEEDSVRFGVGHYFDNPLRDSVYAEVFKKNSEDMRALSDHNQVETGLRLRYQKSFNPNLRLNTVLEQAETENKLTNRISKDLRGSLALAYSPNEKYRFGAHVDTTNNSDNFDLDKKESFRYGLNTTINLNSKQRFSGYWSKEGSDNSSMQLNYDYTFNNGATFGASISNDTFNSDTEELSYLLKISIPFDTPLYRYKHISSLKGKVYNKALQQPVSRAIVNVAGQYAVTDETGNYHFKAIREGKYEISTNLSKTNLNNFMVENDQKQTITLIANKPSTHDIKLFQGTGVNGQIESYQKSSGTVSSGAMSSGFMLNGLEASGGIQNLLVTLTSLDDETQTYRALTSEGGYFNFNGVKSGSWSIQVTDPNQVIEDSRITEPQQIIQLTLGEEKTVNFRSEPLSRQIKKVGPSSGFSVSGN